MYAVPKPLKILGSFSLNHKALNSEIKCFIYEDFNKEYFQNFFLNEHHDFFFWNFQDISDFHNFLVEFWNGHLWHAEL
jgi:hypothetical protein